MAKKFFFVGILAVSIVFGLALTGCEDLFGAKEEEEKTYTVSIAANISNGTIRANPESGVEGTEITLTVTPAANYRLKSGSLKYGTAAIDETTKKFNLPAGDVTVTAEFEQIPPTTYTVTIEPLENGTITANPESGVEGTEITLTVTPAANYRLKSGSLKYGTTAIDESTKKFNLPAGNVTVTAEFEEEVVVTNGDYAGRTFVLYDSALGGLNTVSVHNNTISFEGDLFTNQSYAAWLKNDTRNIDGEEYSSTIITDNSTGWVTAYYDVQGISGITLGRITSSGLYVQVIDPTSQNTTRTFALIDDVNDNSGGSASIGIPAGVTGNLTKTGSTWNMHIEWDAVPGASGYQVQRVYNGAATQLAGQSRGIVTGTSYDAEYDWFVAGEPEVQCFVVRALTGSIGGPYTYGKYSRSIALYPKTPEGSGSALPNKDFS
jgi:hypothetical protein